MARGSVLVVEDDSAIRRGLVDALSFAGYSVTESRDGSDAVQLALEMPIDLVLLDVMLPGVDGFAILKQLRQARPTLPVIKVTARGAEDDRVHGLKGGADDYVVKPYNVEELGARINALLRRAAGSPRPELSAGPLSLDTLSRAVTLDGTRVTLTDFEFRILEILISRKGDVVTRSYLVDQLYQQDYDRDSNVIDVMINRLRKKLAHETPLIETVRGAGYRVAGD